MDYNVQENINEADIDYVIISKNKEDILNELDFENEEERYLCDAIITNLEKSASDTIRNMKVAQIPYIGCVRINPVKRKLREAKLHLSSIRKSLTKEQYKEHVRSYIIDLKEQQAEADRIKLAIIRIRRNNKKKYEQLFKKCGRAYAELFIMSIYWLKEVVFDQEWQEKYNELAGIDKENMDADKTTKEDINIKDILDSQPRYRFK